MKIIKFILTMMTILSLHASAQAASVKGVISSLDLNTNRLVVGGKAYSLTKKTKIVIANYPADRLYFNDLYIGALIELEFNNQSKSRIKKVIVYPQ